MIDLAGNTSKFISPGKTITLVRCFPELPDVIFTCAFNPKEDKHYLNLMFPDSNDVVCQEPHLGPITDIFFKVMNGQKIVFTACQDSKVRAFSFEEDYPLEKKVSSDRKLCQVHDSAQIENGFVT
jgi:hypothetical protein